MKHICCFLKKKNHQYIIGVTFFILLGNYAWAQRTLSVGGTDWVVSVPAITEAGADYVGTYESSPSQVQLTLTVPLLLSNGTVSVRYQAAPVWNNALTLWVKRNDSGSSINLSSLNGGMAYQQVALNDNTFFTISSILALSSFTDISVQLQLRGVSVTIPTGTYQSSVIFTIGP